MQAAACCIKGAGKGMISTNSIKSWLGGGRAYWCDIDQQVLIVQLAKHVTAAHVPVVLPLLVTDSLPVLFRARDYVQQNGDQVN